MLAAAAGIVLPGLRRAAPPALRAACAATVFAVGGALWGAAFATPCAGDPGPGASDAPRPARIAGTALEDPVPLPAPRGAAPRARFRAAVERIVEAGAWRPAAGISLVTVETPGPLPLAGARFEAQGLLRRPAPPANPGAFDHRRRLEDEGIRSLLAVPDGSGLSLVPGGRPAPVQRLRARLLAGIRRRIRGPPGALLENLLLGERAAFDRSLRNDLARTGTLHLLAISGTHLALLAGFLAAAFRLLPAPRRAILLAVLGVLFVYTLVVGDQPSVLRSFSMAAALSLATLAGRRRDPANALAASLLAVLALDPPALFQAGFELSFASVAALLLGGGAIRRRVGLWVAPAPEGASLPARLARGSARSALLAAGLSALCSLATAPILLWHFRMVSPATVPMNLVVLPLVGAMMGLGFMYLGLDLLGLPGPPLLAPLLALLARAFEALVRAGARLPGAAICVPEPGALAWGALAAGALAAGWLSLRGRPLRPLLPAVPAVAALWVGLPPGAAAAIGAPRPARLSVLDVGEGRSAILDSGAGGAIALDAGSSSSEDPAAFAIAPALLAQGIGGLDLLVLSSPGPGRTSALEGLAQRLPIRRALVPGRLGLDAAGVEVLERLDRLRIPVREAAAGDEIRGVPGAVLRVLAPSPRGEGPRPGRGDDSLVLSVRCRGRTILFAGDARRWREAGVRIGDLRCDALVLPRGGHAFDEPAAFLAAARPRIAIASVRARGIPRGLRAALAAARVPLFETAEDGAVLLSWDESGGSVEGFRSRRLIGF